MPTSRNDYHGGYFHLLSIMVHNAQVMWMQHVILHVHVPCTRSQWLC